MKPRIALFGLPKISQGVLDISIYADPDGNSYGREVLRTKNNESGVLLDYISTDIDVGTEVTIVIMSSGICHYAHKVKFNGADISHVPIFRKETNTSEELVSKDWNLELWRQWNVRNQKEEGLAIEKKYLMSRIISVAPIWESYYSDSNIDYFKKFQKLWIGLNSFATQYSAETGDKNRILALVNSQLRIEFNKRVSFLVNQDSAEKWRELQTATRLDMSSEIVRDEIGTTCPSFDFLELSKSAIGLFTEISKELEGIIFLDKGQGKDVFRDITTKYRQYMASEEGIPQTFNLSDAFRQPRAPESVQRIGRLIYHNPYFSGNSGNLFSLEDYFGTEYSGHPYTGQTTQKLKDWETVDPLFFKYLHVLYKFRCAYFHGDLPPSKTEQ